MGSERIRERAYRDIEGDHLMGDDVENAGVWTFRDEGKVKKCMGKMYTYISLLFSHRRYCLKVSCKYICHWIV